MSRTASSCSPATSTPGTTARWTTRRPTRRCSRSPASSALHATEDAQLFAEAVVRDLTGQPARGRRISRAGDQSFWGAGVPSAFMSLSGIPRQDTELARTMERLLGTSGFPWWWHTREDTVDKIDAGVDLVHGVLARVPQPRDRKSTRLNSSHLVISYAVFCLKKKKNKKR